MKSSSSSNLCDISCVSQDCQNGPIMYGIEQGFKARAFKIEVSLALKAQSIQQY